MTQPHPNGKADGRSIFNVKATGGPNGSAAPRVDLGTHLTEVVYPALFECLDAAFPEFNWTRRGDDAWEAATWPAGFPYPVQHQHPDRLMVYRDRPHWIKVHGHQGLRWLDYLAGGTRPRGPRFIEIVRDLCSRAGVSFPERQLSAEEEQRLHQQQERRAVLEDFAAWAAEVLWSPAGANARAYLGQFRGLTDDDVHGLGLGLCTSAVAARQALLARGHTLEACKAAGVLWRRLEGYVTIPWADERGQPLTIYGRWPAKELPLMQDVPAWHAKRQDKRAAWEKTWEFDKSQPWLEPAVAKTVALPGKDTKAAPLCLDRALRAGCREVVLVEGVFDALYLQVRGDARVIASVAAQLSGE